MKANERFEGLGPINKQTHSRSEFVSNLGKRTRQLRELLWLRWLFMIMLLGLGPTLVLVSLDVGKR